MTRPGLTLIEIVLTLSSLVVLSAVFYPEFSSYEKQSQPNSQNRLIANLQSGVELAHKASTNEWLETTLPDTNGDGIPDHIGDHGNPVNMPTFFSGVLYTPVSNANFSGAGYGVRGWKSSNGWLPHNGRYYYYFDSDGNNRFTAGLDWRIYYDPVSGQVFSESDKISSQQLAHPMQSISNDTLASYETNYLIPGE